MLVLVLVIVIDSTNVDYDYEHEHRFAEHEKPESTFAPLRVAAKQRLSM
ncbi:hypothetical protein OAS39_12465 [Pirellulales bacterium]|nr:hypothetical protein [Pirellulales bacterium]